MKNHWPMLLLALTACSHTFTAGDAFDESTVESGELCAATIRTLAPESDGQSNFYFRDSIMFSVSTGAETAEIILKDGDGITIKGTTWVDDQVDEDEAPRVIFTPDEPLSPETQHTATMSYCGGAPSVSFRTSSLGLPIEDPTMLNGWTYTMDLSKARVDKPGIGAQALLTLVDNHLALQVNGLTEDALNVTVAPVDAATGVQDTCMPTLHADMPNNFKASPTFTMGPIDVPVTLAGYKVTLYDAQSSATFAADGSYFAGGTISGSLDARDLVNALSGRDILPTESPEAVCDVIANAKLPCTECDDGEPYCLYLEVREVSGDPIDTVLDTITKRNCDVYCEKSCDNDECVEAAYFPTCTP